MISGDPGPATSRRWARQFEAGHAKRGGVLPKRKGVTRRTIVEFARSVLEQPLYRKRVLTMAREGTLPPYLEVLLYQYAYGKPIERVAVVDQEGKDAPGPVFFTFGIDGGRVTGGVATFLPPGAAPLPETDSPAAMAEAMDIAAEAEDRPALGPAPEPGE